MLDAEIKFLEALHKATELGAISWFIVRDEERDPNEDRAIYAALVGDKRVEVELVNFMVAKGQSFEVVLARVSGLGVWFHVAVGTKGYDLVIGMLSMCVFGWSDGRRGGLKALQKATALVERLLAGET